MTDLISFFDKEEIEYKEDVSFKTLTTYRTGGMTRLVVYPSSVDILKRILDIIKDNNISFKVFGNGSNILASDNDYDGVIIKLTKLNNLEIVGDLIHVEAGYHLAKLANFLCNQGISGLEFACGIPGTIGGAIYMNAGAYLSDMSDIVVSVDLLDNNGNIITLKNKELDFSYRKSNLSDNEFICLREILKTEKKDRLEILDLIDDRKMRRIESQPLEYPSAGSVFRNPDNMYAGKLIEELGLKGFDYGGASISEKHANFIINQKNATSSDIKFLMDLAHEKVFDTYNVDLHREQELFNWE